MSKNIIMINSVYKNTNSQPECDADGSFSCGCMKFDKNVLNETKGFI